MATGESDLRGVVDACAEASAEAIADMVAHIPARRFEEAARMIETARYVAVAAALNAGGIAACLGDGLSQIGYRCRQLQARDEAGRELVSGMGAGDLLIAISLEREAGPLTDVVSMARRRHVPVLAIGLPPEAFGARETDLALVVESTGGDTLQPLAPHFVLVQSLLLLLSDR